MTWDGNKLSFKTIESIVIYMTKRLSGAEKTEPSYIESKGDCPEDTLIQYYRHGNITNKERGFFWTAWRDVLHRFFVDRDVIAFQNGISLAYQLQPPTDLPNDPTDFLPKRADEYNWGSANDHPFQQAILKLFLKWSIISEGADFWSSAFRGYLDAPDLTSESQPSLISAYNGMGKILESNDYQHLLTYVARRFNDHRVRQLRAIFEDQIFRFGEFDEHAVRPQDALTEGWDHYLMTAPRCHKKSQTNEQLCTITRDLVKILPEKTPHNYGLHHIYCINSNPKPNARQYKKAA